MLSGAKQRNQQIKAVILSYPFLSSLPNEAPNEM
jgi:hypothetical protein